MLGTCLETLFLLNKIKTIISNINSSYYLLNSCDFCLTISNCLRNQKRGHYRRSFNLCVLSHRLSRRVLSSNRYARKNWLFGFVSFALSQSWACWTVVVNFRISTTLRRKFNDSSTPFNSKQDAFEQLGRFCYGCIWKINDAWFRMEVLDWKLVSKTVHVGQ